MSDNVSRRRARAGRLLVSQRNYRRVRDRALRRLANKYQKEYLQLLAEEKEKDVALGKKWSSIAGNDGNNVAGNSNNAPVRTLTGEDEGEL